MNEPKVNLQLAIEHGLTEEEFGKIKKYWEELLHLLNLEFLVLCGVSIAVIKTQLPY